MTSLLSFWNKNKFSFLLSVCCLFSLYSNKTLGSCGINYWTFHKKPALVGAQKQRKFCLGATSLKWFDGNKLKGETEYYKMALVDQDKPKKTIIIKLNQGDRGRGASRPLVLYYGKPGDSIHDNAVAFANSLEEKIKEYSFKCPGINGTQLRKKGATALSRVMTRMFHITPMHLYWCDGKTIKGFQPLYTMGTISRRAKKITVQVKKLHRGRGKNNPLMLEAKNDDEATKFTNRLSVAHSNYYKRVLASAKEKFNRARKKLVIVRSLDDSKYIARIKEKLKSQAYKTNPLYDAIEDDTIESYESLRDNTIGVAGEPLSSAQVYYYLNNYLQAIEGIKGLKDISNYKLHSSKAFVKIKLTDYEKIWLAITNKSNFKKDFYVDLHKMVAPDNKKLLDHLKNWGTGTITAKNKSRSHMWRVEVQYKLYKIYEGMKNFSGSADDLASIKFEVARSLEHGSRFCCDSIMEAVDYSLLKANPSESRKVKSREEAIQGSSTNDIITYTLYQLRAKILSDAINKVFERASGLTKKSDIVQAFCPSQRNRPVNNSWFSAAKIAKEQITFVKVTWNDNADLMKLHKSDSKYTNLCLEVDKESLLGNSDKSYNVRSAAEHIPLKKMIGPLGELLTDPNLKEKMRLSFLVKGGFVE